MTLWKNMRPPLVTSLVATVGEDGSVNASPKSWWTPISYEPPVLMLSVKPDSDTDRNIRETGLFVLHLPTEEMAKSVLHTAKPLPYGDNELDDQGIKWQWLEHDQLYRSVPYIPEIPWMVCWVTQSLNAHPDHTDHNVYTGQVGLAGGFEEDSGVTDILLHRSRNEFVTTDRIVTVEPY